VLRLGRRYIVPTADLLARRRPGRRPDFRRS
jgi:hypothetical protein